MVKIRLLLVLLIITMTLCSCDMTENKKLSCFDGAFFSEYSYVIGDTNFRVSLEASLPDSNGERKIKLSFSEPETLSGIICEKDADRTLVSFQNVAIEDNGALGFLNSANLFFPVGEAVFCERTEIDGRSLEHFKIGETSVFIDSNTELPVLIIGISGGISYELHIIRFEVFGG